MNRYSKQLTGDDINVHDHDKRFVRFKMIKLNAIQLQKILSHAESTYPEECCGVILGELRDRQKVVVEIVSTQNVWNPETAGDFVEENIEYSRKRRYTIAPREMLRLQKEARERNLNIIGIFHSHPDYPATPSEFDREYAWQEYSYIIASVEKGIARNINSWVLDDNRKFQPEEMRLRD